MRKWVTPFPALVVKIRRMVTFEIPMRHSHKLMELARRRRRGARLLAPSESSAEVARQIGSSRRTVMRWDHVPHFGRPERLSTVQRRELVRLLQEGAMSADFPAELWTLPRIA